MSIRDSDKTMGEHQEHVDEVVEKVRRVIVKSVRFGKLAPNEFILDALFIDQARKGYTKMTTEMRCGFERAQLREIREKQSAAHRCAIALELAILYAAMAEVGESPKEYSK